MINNVNYERRRTRDLLLNYYPTPFTPPIPCVTLPFDYTPINLETQLYNLAAKHGFAGTKEDFINQFAHFSSNEQILFANYSDFPQIGTNNKLYFDLIDKTLYYWDDEYLPINTMLIPNTTIDGGEA